MNSLANCGIYGDHDDSDIVIHDDPPAAWQRAWRQGIAPQLTTEGLQGLQKALQENNPALITGATTFPPPLHCVADWPVQGCCPLCWLLLDGKNPHEVSVGQLEERFAQACCRADQLLGEPAAVRYFLNEVDEWTREELRQNLLPEVDLALTQRQPAKQGGAA